MERYLGYHAPLMEGADPVGIALLGAKYDARFGQVLHTAMATCLRQGKLSPIAVDLAKQDLSAAIDVCFPELNDGGFMRREQSDLLHSLITHWCELHLARLLNEYTVISVEVEQSVVFQPIQYLPPDLAGILRPLEFPFRADAILRRKSDEAIFIFDFKTTKAASEDWAVNLDHSLQSCTYLEACSLHLGEYVAGIIYAGMVKGRREEDKALSSPYRGNIIQYGSFLYGWADKAGVVYKDYVKGRQRVYLGVRSVRELTQLGYKMETYFPITVPWKPINIPTVIGQQIVAENNYQNSLDALDQWGMERQRAISTLMEQHQFSCYKYGTKHPCQFVQICHGGLYPDEIPNFYEERVDHHGAD
jgi:hypothetical protein